MKLKVPSARRGGRQRGVSIITAIFILLLFAALAAFMTSLVSTAHITSAQDVQGARAYQAAQAGVEWGLFQLDPNGDVAGLPACFATNPAVLTSIPGYSVSVSCTRYPGVGTSYAEAGRTIRIFEISATATATGSSPVTVERQVRARIEKCRDAKITAAPYDC
jgi:MSHA biogenesis protein MshP